MIIEITDIMKAGNFDYIIVETVGVGQSEIEIAGLADSTVVVLVPEAGDEVQTMKAGLMEVADIFVVNKADRPGADVFLKNLKLMLAPAFQRHAQIPIIKTIASQRVGIDELLQKIQLELRQEAITDKRYWLLAEKAYHLITQRRMVDVNKEELKRKIEQAMLEKRDFNLYKFISGI
jgi:LAO/AO transport system kinase